MTIMQIHKENAADEGIQRQAALLAFSAFKELKTVILVDDDVDIYFARQLVFERLGEAKEIVPKGVEVSLGPIATAMGEIYQFTLEGNMPKDELSKKEFLTELRTLQEWVVNPQLKSIQGVNEINSFGGYFKQYQVTISPEKLLKYDLSVDDVFTSIEKNNQNVGGNIIEKYSEQYIVRGVGLVKSIDDLNNIVLKSYQGTPTFLKDVALVKIGEAVRQGAAMINGKDEAVGGIVMMLRGDNDVDLELH